MGLMGGLVGAGGSLRRRVTTVLGGMILVGAIALSVRGGGNNNIIQRWEVQRKGGQGSASGSTVAYMTSSGSLSLSGSLTVLGAVISSGVSEFPNTVSGALVYASRTLASSGSLVVEGLTTLNGAITLRATMSGSRVDVIPLTGTATVIHWGGVKGSHECHRDTDGAGWTAFDCLDGTCTGRIASAGECP